jgi:hypothetical protein
VVLAKVDDSAQGCGYRADDRSATAAVLENFPANAILFVCKGVGHMGGSLKIGNWSRGNRKTPFTNKDLDILQEEGAGGAGNASVFARTEQEEKGDNDHVGDSSRARGAGWRICSRRCGVNQGEGNGLDSVRSGIFPGVSPELAVKAEINVPLDVETWVRGPQAGERLAHGT